ncbi:hypothetical protein JOF41_002318 [Saccharothrix coeruleofusca]|uniref:endo alpha-1,4 polygalactosaminidase n=1 Tax=Saccharothrix coeruleofusca TaxID=33919 RepID=UPI001AE4CE94|nr:endo alpha-1,4 polygalactosaminidase [Saccharothrix coeruleofusca]MBP2336140.1 hypothetical protein [Saccharothrix coeruleofusca]
MKPAVLGVVLLGAVVAGAGVPAAAAATAFPVGVKVDYQLGGAYDPPNGVGLVVRDSTAEPEPGLYNVCYVNGFQTQPQDRELWLQQRRDLVLTDGRGRPVVDPGWPDELILDTSKADKRARIAAIIGETVRVCAESGFDAVEFDNLDSYTRSNGRLSLENNLAMATELVAIAHRHDLLAGQKNTTELGTRGRDQAGFDFAVAEECVRWDECSAYTSVYGQRVFDVEYTDDLPGGVEQVCRTADRPAATLIRDRDLVPVGEPGYFYRHC